MTQIEVTHHFNFYRECARSMWNLYFREYAGEDDFDTRDQYNHLCKRLFLSLVLDRLEEVPYTEENDLLRKPLAFLHVIPTPWSEGTVLMRKDNVGDDNNVYWENRELEVIRACQFEFVNYYDFDNFGYRDLSYLITKIKVNSPSSQFSGKEALIAAPYASIHLSLTQT